MGDRESTRASKPIFIHISKNAGTSIRRAGGDHIVDASHRTAADWVEHHGNRSPMFAVIRHPYERVASEYWYRRRRFESGEENPHLSNLHLSFDGWVHATYARGEFRTRAFFERTGVLFNRDRMVDDVLIWFIPQTRWLMSSDGVLLTDELLRFERLGTDWRQFCRSYRIPNPLPHLNSSARPNEVVQQASQETLDVLATYFRDDFEAFGYER